ncbi:MAG: iron ABC transporter permease [Nitriliruptoraceae bacterium]
MGDTTVAAAPPTVTVRDVPVQRLSPRALGAAFTLLAGAVTAGLLFGPAGLPAAGVLHALVDAVPGIDLPGGLSDRQLSILWQLRVPRVVLGGLVGGMLAIAGAGYQGVFRNPLADPYLLGVAAGAGLGATLAIVTDLRAFGIPLAAFVGAVVAVAMTYVLGSRFGGRSSASLILAGVAVAAFFTAMQTYVQQRHADTLQEVYGWLLGRLLTAGWNDVRTVLPYVAVASAVLLAHRRLLDVLTVGSDEARALGVPAGRVRLAVVVAATLGTAAAVSVSGLIGFVGIVVPHTVRLLAGSSYRIILPLSLVVGAAGLIIADVVARTAVAPGELPIGVVTAFVGAPFFLVVLRRWGAR